MTAPQFLTEEQKRKFAHLHAAHAVAALKLCKRRQLVRVSLVSSFGAPGSVETKPLPGKPLSTLDDLLIDLRVALSSRAAEELFFGSESVEESATFVQPLRMSQAIIARLGLPRAEAELVSENLGFARQFVEENRQAILAVATALLERSLLSGKEAEALVNSLNQQLLPAADSGSEPED